MNPRLIPTLCLALAIACDGDKSGDSGGSSDDTATADDTGPAGSGEYGVTISIAPRPAYEDSTVTCTYSVDSQDDWRLIWVKNYQEIIGVEGDSIDGEWFDKGDWVACAVEFSDGVRVQSDRSNINNTPPELLGGTIEPAEPTEADHVIYGTIDYTDIDPLDANMAEHYRWFVNGVETALDEYVIGRAYWKKGDEVSLKVWVSDGDDTTDKLDAGSVIVGNAAPLPPEIGFVEDPVGGQDLECLIVEEAEDLDGDPVSYTYEWRRFGLPIAETGSTISPAEAGAYYTCTVTPTDGEDEGESVSASVSVGGGVIRYLWRSEVASGRAGDALYPAADYDGDGITDVLAGRTWSSEGDTQGGGVALLGSSGFASDPEVGDEVVLFSLYGEETQGYFGSDVAWLDDLDGDGAPELAVAEPGYELTKGAVYVYLSSRWTDASGDLATAGSSASAADADVWYQAVNDDMGAGNGIAAIDYDDDGAGDLLVGVSGREDLDMSITGGILIFPDDTLATYTGSVDGTAEYGVNSINGDGDGFGTDLIATPDFDGDGLVDAAASAPGGGLLYLFSSSSITEFSDSINNIACATLSFETSGGATLDEVELDAVTLASGGIGLVVGLPADDGQAWLWPVSDDTTNCTEGEVALSSSAYGFSGSADQALGTAAAGVGALDDADDGDWIALGAPGDSTTYEGAGALYLVPSTDWTGALDAGSYSGSVLYGENAYDAFGSSALNAGDLNGDGAPDVAVGVPRLDIEEGFDLGGVAIWLAY